MDGQRWTVETELLARTLERSDAWGLVIARLLANKKQQKFLPDKSIEIPRPGQAAAQEQEREKIDRVVTDPREIAAWFAA